MILDTPVSVQRKTTTYDSEGMPVEAWASVIERSNKQPLSGEIAFKDYGISDSGVTNLFFLKASTLAIESGRITDNAGTYEIYRIERYPNHCEAIVRPVTE
ncbi:MAG: hypothetical protein PHO15_00400 [Eubacteriales bacterium]|nr:hypothetical protein [Eubacteriales bacterium]